MYLTRWIFCFISELYFGCSTCCTRNTSNPTAFVIQMWWLCKNFKCTDSVKLNVLTMIKHSDSVVVLEISTAMTVIKIEIL